MELFYVHFKNTYILLGDVKSPEACEYYFIFVENLYNIFCCEIGSEMINGFRKPFLLIIILYDLGYFDEPNFRVNFSLNMMIPHKFLNMPTAQHIKLVKQTKK